MITIKKYPNRRLYNTSTSTYINLEGIQQLILSGESVVIVDSKTGANVTTATLLLHALDAEIIEALIPSEWMQALMRMPSNTERLDGIHQSGLLEDDSESETQAEEKTVPKVATVQPVDMIVSSLRESDSESSDSDSEVTVVRGDDPPTQPIAVARHDVSAPIEVQVSMDAWGVSGDIEDSEIPSFWSDSALDPVSLDDAEFDESEDSSDDGLFDQPETVVVQHREPTSSKQVDNLREGFADQMEDASLDAFPEDSSERESSSDTSESSVSSSSSPVSEFSSEPDELPEVQEGVEVATPQAEDFDSSASATETATNESNAPSKSDQMKARLAAMRAKLNR